MAYSLQKCVDCGRELSKTATTCNNCNSTDPSGKKRLNDRIHLWVTALIVVAIIITGGLWYTGLIDLPALPFR